MEHIPLLESTHVQLAAVARELERAKAALEAAQNTLFKVADEEWPYEEDYLAPEGAKWKEPGVDALRWLGCALERVVNAIHHGDLADEAFFIRHLNYIEPDDLPF